MSDLKFYEKIVAIETSIIEAETGSETVVLARLKPMLSEYEVYKDFFLKLESAKWIIALKENGFFSSPPPIEKDGNDFRHCNWPESNYLMRMADQAPAIVTETILKIPETDNERVHEDFVKAASKMPMEWATKIAKKELKWIKEQTQFYFLYPDYVGALIVNLSECNETALPIHLAEALLALDKTEREYGVPGEEGYHKSVDVVAKFSVWEYKRVVEKIIPSLINMNGTQTFSSLCDLLEKGIELDLIDPNPPCDYSYIWLTAIEDHQQNRHVDSDLKAILAVAIRNAALQILERNDSQFVQIIAELESKKWVVFKRIALFLLSQYAKSHQDDVAKKLTDKSLFDDDSYRHEYALLSQAGFGLVGDMDKQKILSWIEAEPNDEKVSEYKEWYVGKHEVEASDEDIVSLKEQSRLHRLWQFRDHLPKGWNEKYARWVQKYGEPEHPDFSYYM